ncbi:hypothetical protein RRG08_000515 [Elysia crispata]|uniref:Uncharacterized protein n=1 Tax=Elysia crispata TaxID=231223 RepID=A0AAE1CWC6_9GAST|nr:hypothetical protein RRG08_000515 [Elysia crispata]
MLASQGDVIFPVSPLALYNRQGTPDINTWKGLSGDSHLLSGISMSGSGPCIMRSSVPHTPSFSYSRLCLKESYIRGKEIGDRDQDAKSRANTWRFRSIPYLGCSVLGPTVCLVRIYGRRQTAGRGQGLSFEQGRAHYSACPSSRGDGIVKCATRGGSVPAGEQERCIAFGGPCLTSFGIRHHELGTSGVPVPGRSSTRVISRVTPHDLSRFSGVPPRDVRQPELFPVSHHTTYLASLVSRPGTFVNPSYFPCHTTRPISLLVSRPGTFVNPSYFPCHTTRPISLLWCPAPGRSSTRVISRVTPHDLSRFSGVPPRDVRQPELFPVSHHTTYLASLVSRPGTFVNPSYFPCHTTRPISLLWCPAPGRSSTRVISRVTPHDLSRFSGVPPRDVRQPELFPVSHHTTYLASLVSRPGTFVNPSYFPCHTTRPISLLWPHISRDVMSR